MLAKIDHPHPLAEVFRRGWSAGGPCILVRTDTVNVLPGETRTILITRRSWTLPGNLSGCKHTVLTTEPLSHRGCYNLRAVASVARVTFPLRVIF